MTKVHRVTILIVNHDDLDENQLAQAIEDTNYPNDCIDPMVLEIETRETEWRDDHPLNKARSMFSAVTELFDGEG